MWSDEHGTSTTAAAEAIWRLWADVERWGEWNGDIERIRIDGPFETGSTIAMMPRGQDEVILRLTEVSAPTHFTDEAAFDGLVIRTEHRIEDEGPSRRVSYRIEITGEQAGELGPVLGPQISGDFPETIAELVRRAQNAA